MAIENISSEGRVACYLWYNIHKPNECKFGDTWVEPGEDILSAVMDRVRESQGINKRDLKNGTVKLVDFWDVTDFARANCPKRLKKHGKVDDFIRPIIGPRRDSSGDFHSVPPSEAQFKVNQYLSRMGQPLPLATVSLNQFMMVHNVIDAIKNGRRNILADLCVRFGKTIGAAAIIRETNARLTILPSYVLTSFSSFRKELAKFEQFKDIVVVDSQDPDYQHQVNSALKRRKQVVVVLSMYNGSGRQSRIDFLFGVNLGKNKGRLVIVDEADYGVHQPTQANALLNARSPNDVIMLMTGTNADKAVSVWPIDHFIGVTYPELLIERTKVLTNTLDPVPYKPLTHFEIDTSRSLLTVPVKFYQLGLGPVLDLAKASDPGLFVEDGIYTPSWSKFAADPIKAKGFFIRILQMLFLGYHLPEYSADSQLSRNPVKEGPRVAMMFMPGSTTNSNLGIMVTQAREALGGYHVVQINGDTMTNATAEAKCKEEVATAFKQQKSVLIISAGMAARSFSIPEITELYLAYDSGDNGATGQKIGRTLTPDESDKIGRVISLSFDPNRDDKFDAMILETALNYQANKKIPDYTEAMREVLRTVDVFRCLPNGAMKIEVDDYLAEAMARSSIYRVIGKTTDLTGCTKEELKAIAAGNAEMYKNAQHSTAHRGKTFSAPKKGNKQQPVPKMPNSNDLAKAREVLVTIAQNMDIIRYYGGNNLDESFALLDDAPEDHRTGISSEFGVDYDLIKMLVQNHRIKRPLLDITFNAK